MKTARTAVLALIVFCLSVLIACVSRPALKAVNSSESGNIRDTAAETIAALLESIPYRSGPALLDALARIEGYRELAVPPLERGLLHPKAEVRTASAYVLGNLGDTAALRPLRERENDPVPSVRYETAIARLSLGDWTSVSILIAGLRDQNLIFRFKCFETLRSASGFSFGYDIADRPEKRNAAADCWQSWWERVALETFNPSE